MQRSTRLLLLGCAMVAGALLIAGHSHAQTTAFPATNPIRPNGWDLDGDGIVGEPGQDDRAVVGEFAESKHTNASDSRNGTILVLFRRRANAHCLRV